MDALVLALTNQPHACREAFLEQVDSLLLEPQKLLDRRVLRAAGHTPSHRVDFKFAAMQHDSKSMATHLC